MESHYQIPADSGLSPSEADRLPIVMNADNEYPIVEKLVLTRDRDCSQGEYVQFHAPIITDWCARDATCIMPEES